MHVLRAFVDARLKENGMTHSEAEKDLLDSLMWGEKVLGVNLAYVMDGEPMDECIQLIAEHRDDDARDWLRSFVKRFIDGETGQKLVDYLIKEDQERRRDSMIDAEIHRRKLLQEA